MGQTSSNTLHVKYLEENITQMPKKNGISFDDAFIIRQCYYYYSRLLVIGHHSDLNIKLTHVKDFFHSTR